jgi:hypothetical protein
MADALEPCRLSSGCSTQSKRLIRIHIGSMRVAIAVGRYLVMMLSVIVF